MSTNKIKFSVDKILLAKCFASFVLGVAGAFAFAPHYIFALLVVSFSALMYLLFRSKSYKESFLIGWFFGFGFFLTGLYWIAYPLIFYYLNSFWWLVPFALILIPVLLAAYHGVCAIVLHKLNKGKPVFFAIYFLCLWILFEALRNKILTGFPWLITGYSLMNWNALVQSASLFGVFGLSVISLSGAVIGFLLFNGLLHKKFEKSRIIVCLVLAVMFAANYFYGWQRLDKAEIKLSSRSKIKIVQPNISRLLERETMDTDAEKIIRLAQLNPNEDRDLQYVLLPEGGLNYFSRAKMKKLIEVAVPQGGYLIGGGDRIDYTRRMAWNSMFILNHNGAVIDAYDKSHLVPFGEYVPFRKAFFERFDAIVSGFSNNFFEFSAGAGPRTILPGTEFSFSPLICYESLFSQDTMRREDSPQLLINFTTDKWYKDSSGPYQHFDMGRLRAIEFGVPLIRVAMTGISAVIDPHGLVLTQLALNKEGTISSFIPLALKEKTFYAKHGDMPALLLLVGIFFVAQFTSLVKTHKR